MTHPFKLTIIFALLVCAACRNEAGTNIPYPSPQPDTAALRFLPGIVSKDSLDFNSAFSPDGQTYYFCRSSGGKYGIWQTEFQNGKWTEPVPAPFSEPAYSHADPFFGPDGSLYFISNRPKTSEDMAGDYDIWYVRQEKNGRWAAPQNVPGINSDSTEYYVSLAANGNIYFASNRTGDFEIYYSRLENGRYTVPENLGPSINAPGMEHDPFISPDEKTLLYTAVDRKDGLGSADIYISRKTADGWSKAVNAGPKVNTPDYEYCSYITPDGKYFFFSSEFDVKWIPAAQLGIR